MTYQYITIFMTSAERAKEYLENRGCSVRVDIQNECYVITYRGSVDDYNAFADYMGFMYAV